MKNKNLYIFLLAPLAALLYLVPTAVFAASISFVPSPTASSVNGTVQFEVHLNTGADSINAADGAISIPGGLTVTNVSTGGSAFSLWPTEPQVALGNNSISFAGGVPGGISPGQDLLLFTITAHAAKPGVYIVRSQNIAAYKNDGLGTRVSSTEVAYPIDITNNLASTNNTVIDSTPPQFVYVEVGKDSALFADKWYLSFSAQDNESGVSSYQVREGWFSPYVPADGYYVLHDQSLSSPIFVRATDAAGNVATTAIPASHQNFTPLLVGGVILLLVLLVFALS